MPDYLESDDRYKQIPKKREKHVGLVFFCYFCFMNRLIYIIALIILSSAALAIPQRACAQINAEQVMRIGQNALYFDDYIVSIQYFNQAIQAKPYLAMPYFFRAIAKLNLEDYLGAEEDATAAIERNPFIADAYEVRGVARQNRGNPAGAIEDYDHALTLLPDNRGLMFNKALAQEDVKDYDGASETYRQLLRSYPRYENGYLGRARLELTVGDTIAAQADLDKALELNDKLAGAYVMRADIALKGGGENFEQARSDLDEAIKLQPKQAGLYINRAYVRYRLDDFRGALADYETSISLDPLQTVPYFNRGLLRMETLDNDRALTDFSQVLQLAPNDYRALYNRAMIYTAKRDYASAIADILRVVEAFPDFAGAVYTRFTIYNEMGDRKHAIEDYDRAMAMFRADRQRLGQENGAAGDKDKSGSNTGHRKGSTGVASDGDSRAGSDADNSEADDMARESADEVARRFSTLLTIDNNIELEEEHNNKNIRGKVQDRNQTITLEPLFSLSYYADNDAIANSALYYLPEVGAANDTRALRHSLTVTLHDTGPSSEDEIQSHFQSVDYYNSYLSTHNPRAIDYLGRGMDFMMLHNYSAAIEDFSRAIKLTPDFTLAYFMRANARYKELKAQEGSDAMDNRRVTDRHIAGARAANAMAEILADIDCVIALAPRMALAHYNRGNILAATGDSDGAIAAYTKALELEPGLGVADYNRGYLYMQQGDSRNGTADLSHAGELGIASSYNLLKRMHK